MVNLFSFAVLEEENSVDPQNSHKDLFAAAFKLKVPEGSDNYLK